MFLPWGLEKEDCLRGQEESVWIRGDILMSPLRHEHSDEECEIVYHKVDDLLTSTLYLTDNLCDTSVMWEV